MRAVPGLTLRLLRGSGGGAVLSAGLSAFAVAVSVALLLLTLGVNYGFAERAERASWLTPDEAGKDATAIQAVSTDFVRGEPITVVDLASSQEYPPAPPGMDRFPKPGEIWPSPALAELARGLRRGQLADRLRALGTRSGTLGEEALTHPDQLVVVVGRDAGDPAVGEARPEQILPYPYAFPPTRVAGFSGSEPYWYLTYEALAAFATVLVVVPLLVLGAAAGRLATAQRDRRLSAMRLVGATPGQVFAVTTLETVVIGAFGTLIGALAYAACLPAASRVEAMGGAWFVSDLWVGTGTFALTLVAAPLIVGASALFGMRRLVVSPLGVARRQRSRGARAWRLLLFVALLAGYAVIAPSVDFSSAALFAVLFGALFLALSVLGPFVVWTMGRLMARLAGGPETLLAGRRLADDPRSAWRTVGGISLAGFVAGFLAIGFSHEIPAFFGPANKLEVIVPALDSAALADEARDALRDAGVGGSVSTAKADALVALGAPARTVSVRVGGGAEDLDRARTALSGLSPWQPPISSEAATWDPAVQNRDINVAGFLVAAVTVVVASASAAITGVTGILDRRKTFGLLRLAGTPLSVLDGARLRETAFPLAILGGGSTAAGVFCALPLAAGMGVTPDLRSLLGLGALALLAALGVALAEAGSGLSLRLTTRQATAHRE